MPVPPISIRLLFLSLLLSVLPACASSSSDRAAVAQTVYGVLIHSEDDELVEARLGPHRFAFARSYLRLGMAPLNDTTIELVMTMPDLTPLKREPPSVSLEGPERVDVWIRALDEAVMGRDVLRLDRLVSAVEAANKPVEHSLQQIEQQQTLAANRQQMQEPMVLAARETPARAM